MPVTASTGALTTLENARVYLSRQESRDPVEGDLLQIYINAYSRAIRKYTQRQFVPKEDGVSRRFRYEGSGYLTLAPYELRSLSSITLYTDLPQGSWLVLPPGDAQTEALYRLEPRQQTEEGTYLWLSLPESQMFSPLLPEPIITRRARASEVTIVGNWGANLVPEDVELACLIAVANGFRNPSAFATQSLGGFSFSESVEPSRYDEGGMSLPRDARALLAPYKRDAVG